MYHYCAKIPADKKYHKNLIIINSNTQGMLLQAAKDDFHMNKSNQLPNISKLAIVDAYDNITNAVRCRLSLYTVVND